MVHRLRHRRAPFPMLDLATLAAATTSTTVAGTAKKSGGGFTILLPLLILAAAYLLFLRPRQQKAKRAQMGAKTAWGVGDRVQSVGGIKGIVESIEGDDVRVQVDDDVVLTFTRRAIGPAPASDASSLPPPPSRDDAPTAFGGDAAVQRADYPDVPDEPVVVPDDITGIDFGDSSAPTERSSEEGPDDHGTGTERR